MSNSAAYPLPRAPQQAYTKWFNKTVSGGTFNRYTILWVGSQLECRFKSESINEKIGPHSVFILKKNHTFAYAVIDNTDTLYRLPKKFHTSCFPGIQYHTIPPNNRMKVQITKKKSIELPFIPQSFLQQKKVKTNRSKRKRSNSSDTNQQLENIDFSKRHPTWHVLTNDQLKSNPLKRDIMMLIKNVMDYSCNNSSFELNDPFHDISSVQEIKNDEGKMRALKSIISFLYHYCRSELGCHNIPQSIQPTSLQKWISDLNNTATI
jgi:hypothetical protein